MDYDDNDFHSHNLQLAGEGSNKFPPVLQPYALPKFDFDDNLHGSLKFDSLVETEVFLGIESNEDSQWIEDFSRGSGGIQFSSSAAESCSIPRRNNVWSEATSSESVEMLLKSVGQEELIPAQTNTKESDACDELGCIIKHMEPNLKQDSSVAARVEGVTNLQPTLLPSEFPEKFLGSDGSGGNQPQVEGSARSHKDDKSADQSLGDLTAISVVVRLPTTEGNLLIDGKHEDNQRKVDSVVNESLENRIQESSGSGTQVDNTVATVQNVIQGNDLLSNKTSSSCVNEIADKGLESSGTNKVEHHENGGVSFHGYQMHAQVSNAEIIETDVSHLDNPLCVPSTESVEVASEIETNLHSFEEPCAIPKEASEIETNLHSFEEPCAIPKEDTCTKMLDQHAVDERMASPVVMEGESTVERHEVDSLVDRRSMPYGAVSSSMCDLCSSGEFVSEINTEVHVSSSTMTESMQMREKDVPGHNDIDKDVSVEKKEIVLPSVGSDMDGVIDEAVGPFSFGEGGTGKQVVSKSQSNSTAGEESAKNVPLPSGNDINKDAVFHQKEKVSSLSAVFTSQDAETEIASNIPAEASSSDVKASPKVTTRAHVSAATEQKLWKSADHSGGDGCTTESQVESHSVKIEKVGQEYTKDKDVCLAVCDSAKNRGDSIEARAIENGKNEKEHTSVSAMKESLKGTGQNIREEKAVTESADTRVEHNAVPISDVEQEGGADLDKPAGGSPSLFTNTEVSHDKSNKEGNKESLDRSGGAIKVSSAKKHPSNNATSKDDSSFTFEVTPVAGFSRKDAKKKHSLLNSEASKAMPIVDGSSSSPGLGQLDPKVAQDLSHGSPKVSDIATVRSVSKGNSERKPRRASGKAAAKESAKKGNSARETSSVKSERGDKMTSVSLSSSDLNSSVSSAAVFHQPFTDLQQVQLRAQIFVYGALIQGTPPDEAYMISAFGGSDGGRSIWENAWSSCIERLHDQKSHLVTPETPLQSRSGTIASEQSVKQSALQSKVVSTPVGRGSSKGAPAIVSPIVPYSSPLWSMPTPSVDTLQPIGIPRGSAVDYQQAVSPLHPHQTSGIRNFVGHNPSWLSQVSYGGPWVASPQTSALDTSGRFSVPLPVTETVQLTPVKESSLHPSSAAKPIAPGAQNTAASSIFAAASSALDAKVPASGGQSSTDPKPRRRKKNSVSENTATIVLPSLPQTESVIASSVANSVSIPIAFTTPVSFVSKASAEKLISLANPTSLDLRKENMEQGAILSEDTLGKVKEAKMQADAAAVSAASAVGHSQQVWDQLSRQKNSGLLSDVETKLASAAVAVAAAAAVAKAAAAAAKVASNAALQAKLMVEEAVASGVQPNPSQINVISIPDGMKSLGKATPASILKGNNGTNSSSSILVAAREAARKRVEDASAAAKRAENMDAIVKAAELAAEAVSQAGKIVAMGDPMPLSELVAAGPEGYWKVPVIPELISRSNDISRENMNVYSGAEGPNTLARQLKEAPLDKRESQIASNVKSSAPREKLSEDNDISTDGLTGSGATTMKDIKAQKGCKSSDLAKTIGVVSESRNGSRSSNFQNESEKAETSNENNMKEDSLVEVFKEGGGFKAAWFPAKVLSLNDGKAYVEYAELALGEGAEKLKDWVPLEGRGDEAPKIRIARPTGSFMPIERTRKRRRAAMGDSTWSVGGRVDAWIQDSWWEGVITERSKKDDSIFTVNFPAQGETLAIPAWQLHPSLIWKDGEWVEWSSSGEKNRTSHGGDTPHGKKPRVQSPVVEAKGKDKVSKSVDAMESDKSDDPTLLALSTDEKLFNIGKSNRDESRTDALRMKRTGLQKEGSRVIFGVPKPGKKRKFMEVSKHYVADRSGQMSQAKDSLKFTKYLMPQGPGSRGWKSSKSETTEKRAAISKPKEVKPGKPQTISNRTISQKENPADTAASGPDSNTSTKDSMHHAENTSEKQHVMGSQSHSSGRATEGPILFSALPFPSDNVSSKRLPGLNSKPEQVRKGRLAPAASKLGKIKEDKSFNGDSSKSSSDAVEPRRSNRRIQPTSRLLEGIQSSLMVSKIPSDSHYKSHKSRTAARGEIS